METLAEVSTAIYSIAEHDGTCALRYDGSDYACEVRPTFRSMYVESAITAMEKTGEELIVKFKKIAPHDVQVQPSADVTHALVFHKVAMAHEPAFNINVLLKFAIEQGVYGITDAASFKKFIRFDLISHDPEREKALGLFRCSPQNPSFPDRLLAFYSVDDLEFACSRTVTPLFYNDGRRFNEEYHTLSINLRLSLDGLCGSRSKDAIRPKFSMAFQSGEGDGIPHLHNPPPLRLRAYSNLQMLVLTFMDFNSHRPLFGDVRRDSIQIPVGPTFYQYSMAHANGMNKIPVGDTVFYQFDMPAVIWSRYGYTVSPSMREKFVVHGKLVQKRAAPSVIPSVK